ncbi:MAG: hypothetical protein HC879_17990 [Leptolyngbyaceae cyanobacterium SL_5_9]|nr:hypothetical protein [Leptolyngbyaceae cyanobacterium SL_5_9]
MELDWQSIGESVEYRQALSINPIELKSEEHDASNSNDVENFESGDRPPSESEWFPRCVLEDQGGEASASDGVDVKPDSGALQLSLQKMLSKFK